MTQIEAVYQNGVFKPLRPVSLPENQRVRLSVHEVPEGDVQAWLEKAERLHQRILARRGRYLPDSTPDIAADRLRDV